MEDQLPQEASEKSSETSDDRDTYLMEKVANFINYLSDNIEDTHALRNYINLLRQAGPREIVSLIKAIMSAYLDKPEDYITELSSSLEVNIPDEVMVRIGRYVVCFIKLASL